VRPQEGYCEIQGGDQEMVVMVGKWQKFYNNNSGKFGTKS